LIYQLKEMNFMNAKDNRETNNQAIVTEDLSPENAEASEVKGGYELKQVLITSYQVGSHSGGI